MSTQSPRTLYELTKQSLLSSKTLASAALHDLPTLIFHELFVEAFLGECNEVLKAMVQAWPFPCLPLRTLMDLRQPKTLQRITLQQRNLQTLEALLDGLDMQLSQTVHHSRWRLKVLDWRDVHRDFWTAGPRVVSAALSDHARNNETDKPGLRKKPTLRILAHLCFEAWSASCAIHDELEFCLLSWAWKRRASVHLCCEKVMIKSKVVSTILKLLCAVQLDSIQELDLLSDWGLKSMVALVPQLRKMTNLRTIHLSGLSPELFTLLWENKWHSCIYGFHLEELQKLRDLHIDDVFFLKGALHKIFRSQNPLEALSLSSSPLQESDLNHLIQCPTTSQLKSLSLRNISVKSFNLETLRALLDKLSGTLETLVLERCGFTDSHILAILPTLRRCSQLKTFSCYGNPISLHTLRVLLQESASLSQLTHGLYPAPLESYESKNPAKFVHYEKFPWVCAQLAQVLKDIRPCLRVQICTYSCDWCLICQLYTLEPSGKWEVTEEYRYQKKREQLVTQITSQFLKLHCMQAIYMDSVSFLEGHLVLRLKALAIACGSNLCGNVHCEKNILLKGPKGYRLTRMSTDSPPTLLKLAVQSLLRDEDLAMGAVEDLPGELFPPVFMEAFTRGHTEVLKAMVLSWPFPYLPLGALMSMRRPQTSDAEVDIVQVQERMLQAVLDGLDVLLSQKICSRILKLQVLDMRDTHQKFWRVWAGNELEACSSEDMKRRNTEKNGARAAEQQPLEVILDLWLGLECLNPFQSYLLKWVQKRKGLMKLDYTKPCISPTCIQQVNVGDCWTLFTLAYFDDYLSQLQHRHKLFFYDISVPEFFSPEEKEQLVTQITSEFLKLHSPEEMYMESVSFLEGHLDQLLRCLPSPLETLSLMYCQLSHSDWNQLPQCPSIRHLKHLDLSGIRLTHFSSDPLRLLLSNTAATLTTLNLQACGITDAQVRAFLPALSHCSQLTTFSYMKNCMSVATLESLLCHTARLRNLRLEVYSAPEEIYVPRHGVRRLRLHQIQNRLRRIVYPLNHPRMVWFCFGHCGLCCNWGVHYLHPALCNSCTPI
ncbi:PRAME family member 20/21 [Fukomys damarensis]|uniref:PRAME family member 20/21 n=1 Tax=Fukomys damarensis TaxID=885580 RepID=A0A091DHN1_FUKDA|nr:PRAME family member 20/21 [Fukomys damarensis]